MRFQSTTLKAAELQDGPGQNDPAHLHCAFYKAFAL